MSFRVVRDSKFRHIYGQSAKRQECYDGIRITKSSWDSPFCVVNPKFLAIITEAAGGGSFIVIPIPQVGRIERDYPLISGHKGAVLDIAWCPFNDNVIASSSEDCTVKVWQIPEKWPLRLNIETPVVDLVMHQRRVGLIIWHPTANNILLSAGLRNALIVVTQRITLVICYSLHRHSKLATVEVALFDDHLVTRHLLLLRAN
ncbi:PREDICTED: coronin-6-like [Priapulus caudatus]|uniref:Coronin n=1 Tax=Priapulus caudatus TaxID=37621 RepID=A0ABM1EJ50_PRICU|nr:PREDICTED: coronin-6-like [Priapulus caudatus]